MHISLAPRSIPLLLYPPLNMSVMQIAVSAFPGQVFRLWIAENAYAKGQGLGYNQARQGPQDWSGDQTGSLFRCHIFDTETVELDASVRIHDDHLTLRYELYNKGPEPLEDVCPGTCYQLAEANDFRDQDGDRTYAWAEGRLANIAHDGIPAECHKHHDPDRSSFMRMPDTQCGVSSIGVEARSGGATAMAWRTHNEYAGNTDPALNCIHGGPVSGRIEPGQRQTLHGWLGWSSGSVEELCARAREEVFTS